MNKLIIDNKTDLTDFEAVTLVSKIINQSRISNEGKQYCYITRIAFKDEDYMVCTDLNKRSDRFIIYKE